ncbi:TetR/AcrR family transcriptional regulator [Mycobacterium sp. PS03-16]|uniref:TetR/AcrR family transcriptional regulator n=1 Tax=Mycobacterium sp. PS03-16 TaxID=2559611 RepID=UPI001FD74622|nr:TetR/AcrR family transcriptional regulator [Mycobacterium sp. PS03-16]
MGGVKRGYQSDLRAAQALATRRAVIAAAARLFVAEGYGATTVDAIAEAAGVSRKTVFTAVGGKAELLKAALDRAVAGDDAAVPIIERADVRRALAADDPHVVVRGAIRAAVQINARAADLARVLESAADGIPEMKPLLVEAREQRLADARAVAQRLAAIDALAGPVDDAADVLYAAIDPHLFDTLVRQRGWAPARFEAWLADLAIGQLLLG